MPNPTITEIPAGLGDPWGTRGLGGGVVGEDGADFVDVGAVDADGFVQDLAGDVEFFGLVGDVGGRDEWGYPANDPPIA